MKDIIKKALEKVTEVKEVSVEFTQNENFGDYTTNIALVESKKEKKNPKELAEEIAGKLQKDIELTKYVEKIVIAGAGFINFWLKKDYLTEELDNTKVKPDLQKGKTIMVEFAHPNTHKLFHIGHLRNIITGEAVSRLLSASGAKIIRTNYQGDVGLHIAKALWGAKKLGFKDPEATDMRVKFLGEAYTAGNKAYEEGEEAKEEIEAINKKLYEGKDEELIKLYQTTRKWSLNYFDKVYKRVGTKFDRFYFESETAKEGLNIAKEALKKGILEEGDEKAVIFPGEKYGLHNRVFITGDGLPTYEAKDLALAALQFKEYSPDLVLHVVSSEQQGYFQVLFKALEAIEPETKDKERHLIYGWVSLKEGKMSSRAGNVVEGEWLLNEAKKKIIEEYKTNEATAEQIAVGAVKYSFLKVGLTQDVAFDFKESISLEGNSAPYLQYTYARTRSVIEKSEGGKKTLGEKGINTEEANILRALVKYPEVIENAAKLYSPNLLANYLYDLAQKYNTFYNKHRIIASDNEAFRLKLSQKTGEVIKDGLNILGIETPERM